MTIKKIILSLLLGFSVIASAHADENDWCGVFRIILKSKKFYMVTHTPQRTTITNSLVISNSSCISMNSEDKGPIYICSNSDVVTFLKEINKLGEMVDIKSITYGADCSI
ncbi:MAG: hypothetical protein JSS53_05245 [Proteobacteria bacterium]|nr:hypothetical protein [Pseudomonadota bacterium]